MRTILSLFAWLTASLSAADAAVSELPLAQRVAGRDLPSVFQAWNPADNLKPEAEVDTAARHDLIFHGEGFFHLEWDHEYRGLATGFTAQSLALGRARRHDLLTRNPHLVLLMEIRYRDAWGDTPPPGYPAERREQYRGFLPPGHAWWRRGADGQIVKGWEEGGYLQLDFANPAYRDHVAQQCAAAIASGVVDGVMLDWWEDDADRLALVAAIRARIGEEALILVNANDRRVPQTAPYVNGLFMECYRSSTPDEWRQIADTLAWAEANLRPPRINCLESWYHTSRADLHLMRSITTLSLVLSDGYCLFSDPNPLPVPDHLHDWYPFWEPGLGRPLAPGTKRQDGALVREFEHGTAVHNPLGNPAATLTFDTPRTSRASGLRSLAHTLPGGDGDLYLQDVEVAEPSQPR